MNDLLILISPPASGKTYWIKSFTEVLDNQSIIIVSPLRALADECNDRWHGLIKVVTPEEWMLNQLLYDVVIFDEFHLHFYWGDTFRPILWEAFYALASGARLTVVLTATFSPEMKIQTELFHFHFDQILWCDFGNRQLKYYPTSYIKVPSKNWVSSLIELGPRGNGVNLIFCAYRNEVADWHKKLEALGFTVWSCVGGEAAEMRIKLASGKIPDFIVATSVLSHGVNLPEITCIFFLYPLENLDFWIQMVARGGRKGESYEVFSLENPHGIKLRRSSNFLAILGLSFKMRVHSLKREFDQWFLKESS